jgi:hypothetical protein
MSAVEAALAGDREEAERLLCEQTSRDVAERMCTRAVLGLAREESELFVGGNDSETLLQIVAAASPHAQSPGVQEIKTEESEGMDVMASVLIPEEEVRSVMDARGASAVDLLISYWRRYPEAPLVVRRKESEFAPVLLRSSWLHGAFSLSQVRLAIRSGFEDIDLEVPRREKPPELVDDTRPQANTDDAMSQANMV